MTITTNLVVRWMIRKDFSSIVKIENLNSGLLNPVEGRWTEKFFKQILSERDYIGMVAEEDSKIVAFVVYALHKDKIFICNLAVSPDCEGRGIGSEILNRLKNKLKRRTLLEMDIRESDLGSQLFLKNNGFRAIEVIRDFYENTNEDAYKFVYRK